MNSLATEDSSPYSETHVGDNVSRSVAEPPVSRSLRFSNELTLRDGQSMQFALATDRISGEGIVIEVTINVVK